jgi:hypothetical protein
MPPLRPLPGQPENDRVSGNRDYRFSWRDLSVTIEKFVI